jgi:thiol:disulfide interchange protein DsbD
MVNYGYARDVILSAPITISQRPQAGEKIALDAQWLVCRIECVPQQGHFELDIPSISVNSDHAEFAANLRAVPPNAPAGLSLSASIDGQNLVLQGNAPALAAFKGKKPTVFAEAAQYIDHAAAGQQSWQDGVWQLRLPLNPTLHSAPAQTLWVLADGKTALRIPAQMDATNIAKLQATALFQRNTQGMAVPPALQAALEANAAGKNAQADAATAAAENASLPASAAVSAASVAAANATLAASAPVAALEAKAGTGSATAAQGGLLAALLLALLGGALLNLMPCVFPVLALKVLGFVQAPNAAARRRSAWAYAAGVIISFVALAGVLLALKAGGAALGWGFQLQSAWFLAALALLFTLLALAMSGGLQLKAFLPQRWLSAGSKHPIADSFLSGVLAVAVASPCTAPFMGAALGYALGQNAAAALAVFVALGVGMALPYVLLAFLPKFAALLPKPGAWMDAFKRLLALPLWLTVVWLLWVLGQQLGIDAAMLVLAGLVFAVSIVWLWFEKRYRKTAGFITLLLLLCLWLFQKELQTSFASRPAASKAVAAWQPWSAARQAALVAQGQPVFVDYTAAWCVTCQYNKKAVLDQPQIQQAFAAKGVHMLLADWTNYDSAITASLQSLGRSGLPVYVLIDAQGQQTLLPELLSEQLVHDALARLPATQVQELP